MPESSSILSPLVRRGPGTECRTGLPPRPYTRWKISEEKEVGHAAGDKEEVRRGDNEEEEVGHAAADEEVGRGGNEEEEVRRGSNATRRRWWDTSPAPTRRMWAMPPATRSGRIRASTR